MNNSGSGRKPSTPVLLAGGGILLAVGFGAGFGVRGKMASSAPAHAVAVADVPSKPAPAPAAGASTPTSPPATTPQPNDWTTRKFTRDDMSDLAKSPMTPELARTLMAKLAAETKDVTIRASLSAAILQALLSSGHVDEAWSLLDTSPGAVRCMQLGMLFRSDTLPLSTLLAKLGALTDNDERTSALQGMMQSHPAEVAKLDFHGIPMDTREQKLAVCTGLSWAMQKANREKDPATSEIIFRKMLELVENGKLDQRHLNSVLSSETLIDPFRRWEILGELGEGFSPKDKENFRKDGVEFMVQTDMDRALKLLCSDPQSRYSVPILNKAISTIYQVDPDQANKWITENLSSIDRATGQRVIFSVGQAAIRSGEFATARQWADQLLNPGVKDQLLKQIEAAEKPADQVPR